MNFKRSLGRFMGGALLAAALFSCGCGDKAMTTQPLTPTPNPTSTVSMEVTLTRLSPPAGAKHAALAAVILRETGGRAVQLTRMRASSDLGYVVLQVSGFTPVSLAAGQSTSFTVTLTADEDIDCSDEVFFAIYAVGPTPAASVNVGCEAADWPF